MWGEKMAVGIVKATYGNAAKKIPELLDSIGYRPKKEKILIKPNIASPYGSASQGDITDPRLVRALIEYFSDREIVIGEGCAVGMDWEKTVEKQGYRKLAAKYPNVCLMDLGKAERDERSWKFGKISLPRIIETHEYINVPKLKTHHLAHVTLGMKNQKGLLVTKDKKAFHRMDIQDALYQLSTVAWPDLTLIDGIIAMEGNGPNSLIGKKKVANVLIAGTDLYEVDNATMRVMGLDIGDAPHIPRVEFEVKGRPIESFRVPFKPPNVKVYHKFLNFHAKIQPGCSGCMESVSGGLKLGGKFPYCFWLAKKVLRLLPHATYRPFVLIFGTAPPKKLPIVSDSERILCMGTCIRKFAEEHSLDWIPGCPPSPEAIWNAL